MFKMNYTKGVHFDNFNDILDDLKPEDIDLCRCNRADREVSKAQERKDQPVYSGVLKYFPDALKEVSKASKAGNDQHHPNKPLHWDKTKSFDNEDALVRHLIDHSKNPIDDDGVLHLTKVAWRALASLQIYLENNNKT